MKYTSLYVRPIGYYWILAMNSLVVLLQRKLCLSMFLFPVTLTRSCTLIFGMKPLFFFFTVKVKVKHTPRVCLTLSGKVKFVSVPACLELCSQVMPSISISKLVGHDLKVGHKADWLGHRFVSIFFFKKIYIYSGTVEHLFWVLAIQLIFSRMDLIWLL